MFTGIIETIGVVASADKVDGDVQLVIAAPTYQSQELILGDSIACNGVCLTVVSREADLLGFDVSVESINHSLISEWHAGTRVNLEMALLPTTRLGGHLVSGHVDGVAELVYLRKHARSWEMRFSAPAELRRYIAKKGSITVNGVSLTVNSVDDNVFNINVIPHTFKVTTLGELGVGNQAHIEVDLIARYLESLLLGGAIGDSAISHSYLAEHGFA